MLVAGGATNVTTYFTMRLTADGTAATGLTPGDFDLQYTRSGAAAAAKVDASLNGNGVGGAHSDSTVIEVDATSSPGLYRVDWVDAAFAAAVREVILSVKVATCFTEHLRVEIDAEVNVVEWAGTDVVAGAIPAFAADAAGGLPVSDAGNLDLDTQLANTNEITAARMGALTDWINGGRLDLLLDDVIDSFKGVVPVKGTIGATGNSTTALHLTGLTYGNDELIGYTLVVYDVSNTEYHRTTITDWVLSTELATVPTLDFTPQASTDTYWLLPNDSAFSIWDEVLTGSTHNIASSAGRRLRQIQVSGAVYGGFVWIDTVNGTAGTTDYENGTSDNPVDSIADANSLATSLGLSRFKVAPGSTITLAATQANQVFDGEEWTLDLGTQNIAGTIFHGAAVTGVGTGADAHFAHCEFGATATVAGCRMGFCRFTGTITLSAASDYYFHDCYSGVAGSGTPVIDFTTTANTNLSMRRYSGGIQIDNKDGTGTDTMSLEGDGQLVVSASSGGAISLRGNFKVTNTGGATITTDDDTTNIAAILVDTGTTIPADIADKVGAVSESAGTGDPDTAQSVMQYVKQIVNVLEGAAGVTTLKSSAAPASGVSLSEMIRSIYDDSNELQTDDYPTSIAAVQTAVDAVKVITDALTAAAAAKLALSAGTIVTGTVHNAVAPTTTAFEADDITEATNDHFNGRIILFTSGALLYQATDITDYTTNGGIGVFTVTALTEAPSNNDTFIII